MEQLSVLGFIAIGGAFGACSRYLISKLCIALCEPGFPYGTLTVNVVGSLIMGVLFAGFESKVLATDPWHQFIGVGFLGALTTFSAFSMDTVLMIQQGEFLKMGLNITLNVILSVLAAWAGFQIFIKN